ncbi:hypothetical protein [Pseudorhodoferax sp.]|uniref:hypothetical protein n=1 Tax=Pseudorhodoferax sp. TaxID=1993553 RepID=UPI002DD6773B|nr:hypothetical protein [Pseudorhodoferax sp.]
MKNIRSSQVEKLAGTIFFDKINPLQSKILKRFLKRMEERYQNFGGEDNESILYSITKIESSFKEHWADRNGVSFAWESANEALTICDNGFSISDDLIGACKEACTEWDKVICDYIDTEYDHLYIEAIALRLKPVNSKMNRLIHWRRAFSPEAYEEARARLLLLFKEKSILEKNLLPY